MCGLAGDVRFDGQSADWAAVRRAIAGLHHRGPDGTGLLAGGSAAIGHARLAIVDLSEDARQPFAADPQATVLACNGEIYNAPVLRERFEARGYRFRSRSDNEPILPLYEASGVEGLAELRGMFALAIHDPARRRVVLARDRFGEKP